MRAVRTAMIEVWGLFVEDGNLAASIALWLIMSAALLPHLWRHWRGAILFGGFAVILLTNVARSRSQK